MGKSETLTSPVNGRNLPYSCWMNLSHHDCSVSDEIVKICFHPDEESTKWTLATRYYLSGVEFNLNLTGTVSQGHGTTNSPTISYVEFGRDEYSQIPNQSQSESETPTVVENPVILPFSDTVSEVGLVTNTGNNLL